MKPRPDSHQAMKAGIVLVAVFLIQASAPGAEYYVSPKGKADAVGTKEAPWDIVSVLAGRQAVKAGDTIYLKGGTYRCEEAYKNKGQGFKVSLYCRSGLTP